LIVIPSVIIKQSKLFYNWTVVNAVAIQINRLNETKSKLDYIICANGVSAAIVLPN